MNSEPDYQSETGGFFLEPAIERIIAEATRKQMHEPCRETAMVITKLQEALMWQNERMRRQEYLRMLDEAQTPEGKAAWDAVEAYRQKHGHLPKS